MQTNPTKRFLLLFGILFFVYCHIQAQELKLMLPIGHTKNVTSAFFSPDGTKVVTASEDKTAKIWEVSTGRLLANLVGHTFGVTSAVFSPDGTKVVTASNDKTAKIWEVATGHLLINLEGHTFYINSAVFSPDGTKVVTASGDSTAKIWDASTGHLLANFKEHKDIVTSAVFNPDGTKVLTTSFDKTAKIWEVVTGHLLINLEEHNFYINSAVFSPDGTRVVTTSGEKTAKIWDASTGHLLTTLKGHTSGVSSAVFSPDGTKVITASFDSTAKIWVAATGQLLANLKEHSDNVASAIFSPDGIKVLTASRDNTAKIWDAATGHLLVNFAGHTSVVKSAVFSSDGTKVVTASFDYTAKIWDATIGHLLTTLKGHTSEVNSAVFNPDGYKLVTASRDNIAKIWESGTGRLLASLVGHKDWVSSAVFSPDGSKVLTTSLDTTAKIWETATGHLLANLQGHKDRVISAVFSSDGSKVLTTSWDGTAKIWEAATGHFLANLKGYTDMVSSAIFSPDGSKVVSASFQNTVKILEVASGHLLANLKGHKDMVSSAVFSPDGKKVVTASWDKTAKIWDVVTGHLLVNLEGHTGWVESAIFSPDGTKVITGSYDNTVKIWDAKTGHLEKTIPIGLNTHLSNISFNTNRFTAIDNSELKIFNLNTGEHLFSYFAIDSTDWAVLHPSGLFDASPGAMDKMYWVKGDEVIDFSQLKERYWQPGLWKMILDRQPLRSVAGMNTLQLQPEIKQTELKNKIFTIQLKKRDGGYGKVTILVNNKQVIDDARPPGFDTSKVEQTIEVNLAQYLPEDLDHVISVKTQTADGFVSSRGVPFTQKASINTAPRKPAFYAIICGTGEFSNPAMKLKYPVQDAEAIAKAVTIGANNLFGKDSTHVYLLSSPGKTPTTKQNIKQAFDNIKANAKAEDIVMVYLSGHGISYGGDNGDFYYLTTEASGISAESFADPALRQSQSINTAEFTQWLNASPARKQVMIIDACGSGKAVDNLLAKRDIEASQIKAIDRMKDKTGLFIISGCASDAVSYEASKYGQGLLTYAVLQAMKGAALKENTNVDILTLLNYARDEVPKMATDVGGIQQPQLLVPKGGSFDIGYIRETDKEQIPLAQIKPVFVRATLFEESKKRDVLKLSQAINDKLNEVSARGDATNSIVFIDADEYPNACSISGGYTITGDKINFTGSLLCGTKEKIIKFDNQTKEELINKLVDAAVNN
jgi:WD40 repeat protein